MVLNHKSLPGQFIMDLRNEYSSGLHHHHNTPSDIHGGYRFRHHIPQRPLSPGKLDAEVLDLSRRCDSVETRKTPSPYNSTSSYGTASPSTHCGSPPNSNQAAPQPVPASSATTPTTPNNRLHFAHSTLPLLPHGISSLYPMFYPSIKPEIPSPPPQSGFPIISSPMPGFGPNPALLLQQSLKSSSPPIPARKSEEQESTNPLPLPETGSSLYPSILNAATTGTIHSGKNTRPFNAYPRDPMLVAAHFAASDVLFDNTTMERYSTYRKRALDDLRDTNGGHRVVSNPKMRRTCNRNAGSIEREERAAESSDYDSSTGNGSSAEPGNKNDTNNNNENETTSSGGTVKDQAYYERRRKNNAAAKKSRDRRRIKEDEIAIRAAYLERQNIELLCQIDALKKQLEMFTKV